ncbi:Staphylococcal nuclease domain-containing protein 1 [Taenia crassiceps]|uniref:Staphylococcal nuclease domain-containing protein 1 n=1 Tax=Taenia crassiceps TaxID=6207 RepID=A0ABR4QMW4_9CEST
MLQVISSVTVVIRDAARDGPPSVRTIALAQIVCPKVAKRLGALGQPTPDEPFGWMAREFVRLKVIGIAVRYVIEKEISAGRAYGWIYVGEGPDAANISEMFVSRGLALVRRGISQAAIERNSAIKNLSKLEKKARSRRRMVETDFFS